MKRSVCAIDKTSEVTPTVNKVNMDQLYEGFCASREEIQKARQDIVLQNPPLSSVCQVQMHSWRESLLTDGQTQETDAAQS